jgi:hypothetical protein
VVPLAVADLCPHRLLAVLNFFKET